MPGKRQLDLGAIRSAARALAKQRGSVRSVADEIGVSYTGLRYFLDKGGKPQKETQRRLVAWYVGRGSGRKPTGEELRVAVQLLVSRVREAKSPALKRKRTSELFASLLGELDEQSYRLALIELDAIQRNRPAR